MPAPITENDTMFATTTLQPAVAPWAAAYNLANACSAAPKSKSREYSLLRTSWTESIHNWSLGSDVKQKVQTHGLYKPQTPGV